MTIRQQGGIFGRNPTFNNVEIENDLNIGGNLIINGETITGLDLEGSWNASTNTPDLTAITPVAGQFWIVSVAGSTDLGGITTWDVGDWALYDGAAWQRVEGGGNGTFTKINVDNIQIDGNTISSTDANGDINLTPNGSGAVVVPTLETTAIYDQGSTLSEKDRRYRAHWGSAIFASVSSTGGCSAGGPNITYTTSNLSGDARERFEGSSSGTPAGYQSIEDSTGAFPIAVVNCGNEFTVSWATSIPSYNNRVYVRDDMRSQGF